MSTARDSQLNNERGRLWRLERFAVAIAIVYAICAASEILQLPGTRLLFAGSFICLLVLGAAIAAQALRLMYVFKQYAPLLDLAAGIGTVIVAGLVPWILVVSESGLIER